MTDDAHHLARSTVKLTSSSTIGCHSETKRARSGSRLSSEAAPARAVGHARHAVQNFEQPLSACRRALRRGEIRLMLSTRV